MAMLAMLFCFVKSHDSNTRVTLLLPTLETRFESRSVGAIHTKVGRLMRRYFGHNQYVGKTKVKNLKRFYTNAFQSEQEIEKFKSACEVLERDSGTMPGKETGFTGTEPEMELGLAPLHGKCRPWSTHDTMRMLAEIYHFVHLHGYETKLASLLPALKGTFTNRSASGITQKVGRLAMKFFGYNPGLSTTCSFRQFNNQVFMDNEERSAFDTACKEVGMPRPEDNPEVNTKHPTHVNEDVSTRVSDANLKQPKRKFHPSIPPPDHSKSNVRSRRSSAATQQSYDTASEEASIADTRMNKKRARHTFPPSLDYSTEPIMCNEDEIMSLRRPAMPHERILPLQDLDTRVRDSNPRLEQRLDEALAQVNTLSRQKNDFKEAQKENGSLRRKISQLETEIKGVRNASEKYHQLILPAFIPQSEDKFPSYPRPENLAQKWSELYLELSSLFRVQGLHEQVPLTSQQAGQALQISAMNDDQVAQHSHCSIWEHAQDRILDVAFRHNVAVTQLDYTGSQVIGQQMENIAETKGHQAARLWELALYKQLISKAAFIDDHLLTIAECRANELYREWRDSFPEHESDEERKKELKGLMWKALELSVAMSLSDKSYEIVCFKPGVGFDPDTMQADNNPPALSPIKHLLFPALYQFDWDDFPNVEAARMRSVTFFPAAGTTKKNRVLVQKAIVSVQCASE